MTPKDRPPTAVDWSRHPISLIALTLAIGAMPLCFTSVTVAGGRGPSLENGTGPDGSRAPRPGTSAGAGAYEEPGASSETGASAENATAAEAGETTEGDASAEAGASTDPGASAENATAASAGETTEGDASAEAGASDDPAVSAEETDERLRELEAKIERLARELEQARKAGQIPDERLRELERRIELLGREIEKLRIGAAADEKPLTSKFGLGPAASKVYARQRGVSIGGYGEALYQNFQGRSDDGSPSGMVDTADLQRVVLYFGYKWTERVLFNSEIEFEHATTGEGAEEKGEISVEFANIDFLLHEQARVRAGLVLIPVGFINELHEPPVFLGARRPDVERVIIPATWREVGAGIFGDWGPLSYRGYLVAGLDASEFSAGGIRGGRQGGSQSKAEDLAFTARLDWTIVPGLLVGASVFTGDSGQALQATNGAVIGARTTLVEGHAEWKWRGIEARGLYARSSVSNVASLNDALGLSGASSIGERQAGWYGQVGYDVLASSGTARQSLIPFIRFEAFDTQRKVPGGFDRDPARDVRVITAGLSWKPITSVVIKADWQDFDNRAGTGTDQANLAIGFIF